MNRITCRIVVLCVLAVFAIAALAYAAAKLPPTGPPGRMVTARSMSQLVLATRTQGLTHNSLSKLSAMGTANGQTFGAGSGQVAQIGASGVIASTAFSVPISRATGLSEYKRGSLLLGDQSNNSVFAVNLGTKRSAKLFSLNQLNASRIAARSVLQNGTLGGLAFDGKFIYAGVAAGYSSSIFKIDPSTKTVVGHAWAPGPNPTALQYYKGNLFVLESGRMNIRRFDANLVLGAARAEVDVQGGKGLVVNDQGASILSPTKSSIERFQINIQHLMVSAASRQVVSAAIAAAAVAAVAPQKYAVLICGDCAESGFDEFWGDTVWMYKMLRAKGYTKERIYVLYANGADHASPNPNYQMPGETVTDFAATPANVNMVLDGLKNGDAAHGIAKMKSNDSLFIWMFDHGGGGPTNSYLCLWGGSMDDTDFATKANAIPYEKRAIFMQQCRSGGFVDNLSNVKSFVSSACRGDQNAHQADSEKEYYGGKWYHHGEYNYYIIGAFAGSYPNGTAAAADTNGDGKRSSWEAHQWMVSKENQSETPQSSGNGIGASFVLN